MSGRRCGLLPEDPKVEAIERRVVDGPDLAVQDDREPPVKIPMSNGMYGVRARQIGYSFRVMIKFPCRIRHASWMRSAAAVRHASHRRWIARGSERVERHTSQVMSLRSIPSDRGTPSQMMSVDPGSEKVLGHDSDKD